MTQNEYDIITTLQEFALLSSTATEGPALRSLALLTHALLLKNDGGGRIQMCKSENSLYVILYIVNEKVFQTYNYKGMKCTMCHCLINNK